MSTKAIDAHNPTAPQLQAIRTMIEKYYSHLNLDLNKAFFKWHTGIRHCSGQQYQNGDDIKAYMHGEVWYHRINECLKLKIDNNVILFLFVWWYESRARSQYLNRKIPNGFTLVEKWTDKPTFQFPQLRSMKEFWCSIFAFENATEKTRAQPLLAAIVTSNVSA